MGSQYVTSQVYQKARDLIAAGAIGRINMVEAWLDRNTALGAWQYSIPPDASPANIDWDRFLGYAPKRPFEPIRLFRWRNYRDYGTGVAGDLFVHLLSGLHVSTGSLGPDRIMATGGIRYWEDGRDVPDVMMAILDYPRQAAHPEFTMSLRVNLKSGVPDEQFGFKFMGSEGVITTSMSSLQLEKAPPERAPGYSHCDLPQGDTGGVPEPVSGEVSGRLTAPGQAYRGRIQAAQPATTRTATITACSTRPCAAASNPWKTPCSGSAPRVRRCSPTSAVMKNTSAAGTPRP